MKILTKNPIRECDKEELEKKEENHRKIMENNKNNTSEYVMDRKLYKKVLKDIKKKNKGMFKLLNNAGEVFKTAIYHYMNRIIWEVPWT